MIVLRLGVLAWVFTTTALAANPTVTTIFNSHAKALPRICVLPAEVELSRASFHGASPLPEESDELTDKINVALEHLFAGAGAPNTGSFSRLAAGGNRDLAEALFRIERRYKAAAVQMQIKPEEIATRRYTLGDDVAVLPCAAQSDAIVFVHANGSLTLYRTRVAAADIDLTLCFVDARTGEVIGLVHAVSNHVDVLRNPEKAYQAALQDAFAKLRVGHFIEYRSTVK